jgi:hypothetical protein
VPAAISGTTDARMDERLRRERIDVQSAFLDNFYGKS